MVLPGLVSLTPALRCYMIVKIDTQTEKEVIMQRAIDVSQISDDEGLCYDLGRAHRDGLKEEVSIARSGTGQELRISEEAAFELAHALDLGVNVGPGDTQRVLIEVEYEYVYGTPDTDEVAVS